MTELSALLGGWPLAASIALAATAQGLRLGRRRATLNEALHELRRPLQALALSVGPGRVGPEGAESSLRLAVAALERLDLEINGGELVTAREEVAVRRLLESAVGRWRARAALGGGSLELRGQGGEMVVEGCRVDLSQAFDNLIVNAIEHGGPRIVVELIACGERLRVAVTDSGRASRPASRRGAPAEVISRLAGRGRHGHGLAVVRRIAAAHDGRFALLPSARGTVASLELPLVRIRERAA